MEQPDSLPPPLRCFGLESLEDESTKHPPVMAEFGLAVAVFQLLDQGIKLAHTVASAKDAPGDIQTLLQDLKYLKNVLSKIFCVGKKEPECLQGPINEFTKDLEVLTKSLDDLDLKKTKRVRWALGEEKRVKKATERMEAYKSLFSMAMVADERYATCT